MTHDIPLAHDIDLVGAIRPVNAKEAHWCVTGVSLVCPEIAKKRVLGGF